MSCEFFSFIKNLKKVIFLQNHFNKIFGLTVLNKSVHHAKSGRHRTEKNWQRGKIRSLNNWLSHCLKRTQTFMKHYAKLKSSMLKLNFSFFCGKSANVQGNHQSPLMFMLKNVSFCSNNSIIFWLDSRAVYYTRDQRP